MYILQKRDSESAQWHTCSYQGRKCRYTDIAKARTAYRMQKATSDAKKHPDRQYRIYDTQAEKDVE
ncbi:MAG: hypothetical protein K6G10_02695 [Butyrivibrio sp.]|nr:hypothetical protein [Butyrivibrio sp.]